MARSRRRRDRFPTYHLWLLVVLLLMLGANVLSIIITGEPLPNWDFTIIEIDWSSEPDLDTPGSN